MPIFFIAGDAGCDIKLEKSRLALQRMRTIINIQGRENHADDFCGSGFDGQMLLLKDEVPEKLGWNKHEIGVRKVREKNDIEDEAGSRCALRAGLHAYGGGSCPKIEYYVPMGSDLQGHRRHPAVFR